MSIKLILKGHFRLSVIAKVILLLVFFFSPRFAFTSPALDSLKNALSQSAVDTTKINLLNLIAVELLNGADFDSAFYYSTEAKKLAQGIQFRGGLARSYNTIALVYNQKGNQAEALKNYLEVLKIRKEMGDQSGIANSYLRIGTTYEDQGNYPESMKNYLLALKIYEQVLNDKRGIGRVYVNVGNLYYDQGNFNQALRYYSEALGYIKQVGDKLITGSIYINMANIYFEQGADSSAIKNYNESLKIQEETGNIENAAACYNNLGNIYGRQGNYAKSLENFFLAMNKWKKSGNKRDIGNAYINIGTLLRKQKKYADAEKYTLEGLQLSEEVENKNAIRLSYTNLADLEEEKGNFKKALAYYKASINMKDSLLNESNSRTVAEMQAKYEAEKRENEIAILNKDKQLLNKDNDIKTIRIEKQNAVQWYIISGFLLLTLFAWIAFRLYNQKKKTAFKYQVSEMETKLFRAQMNPHFIFNSLNSIQSLILEERSDLAREYLITFSRLTRAILEQTRKKNISLTQEIETLQMYLDVEKLRFDNKFEYEIKTDDITETDSVILPPLLIQPFVENSIIHGISHKEGNGKIVITFRKNNSCLQCTVLDDGVGRARSEEINKSKSRKNSSIATQLAKDRITGMKTDKTYLQNKYRNEAGILITDLKDNNGKPQGTQVEINIPLVID